MESDSQTTGIRDQTPPGSDPAVNSPVKQGTKPPGARPNCKTLHGTRNETWGSDTGLKSLVELGMAPPPGTRPKPTLFPRRTETSSGPYPAVKPRVELGPSPSAKAAWNRGGAVGPWARRHSLTLHGSRALGRRVTRQLDPAGQGQLPPFHRGPSPRPAPPGGEEEDNNHAATMTGG